MVFILNQKQKSGNVRPYLLSKNEQSKPITSCKSPFLVISATANPEIRIFHIKAEGNRMFVKVHGL